MAQVQPAFQRGRWHGRCAAMLLLDGGVVHADDFVFHLHQQFLERLLGRPTVFGYEPGKTWTPSQPGDPAAHFRRFACQKQVDPFFGNQHRAFQSASLGLRQTHLLQAMGVVDLLEQIDRDVQHRQAAHEGIQAKPAVVPPANAPRTGRYSQPIHPVHCSSRKVSNTVG